MSVLVGLEPLHVILLGLVQSKSITVVEEGVAGAVFSVAAALVNVGVDVAVQDGHGQVVLQSGTAGDGLQVMVADSVQSFHTRLSFYILMYWKNFI